MLRLGLWGRFKRWPCQVLQAAMAHVVALSWTKPVFTAQLYDLRDPSLHGFCVLLA